MNKKTSMSMRMTMSLRRRTRIRMRRKMRWDGVQMKDDKKDEDKDEDEEEDEMGWCPPERVWSQLTSLHPSHI